MSDIDRSKWRKDAWDRDLGPCLECEAKLRQPCTSDIGYTRSPHEGRTVDPALAVLHVEGEASATQRDPISHRPARP